jgi:uncharacterized membrane protein
MGKHSRQIKAAGNKEIARVEHTEVFDDNLLPDASEIEKLSTIDPTILQWLKDRAEKEQDFRHKAYEKRIKLTNDHNRREHNTARWALLIYFVLVFGCIAAAFWLIREGKNTQGTIFGSAAVILGIAVLIAKKPSQSEQQSK